MSEFYKLSTIAILWFLSSTSSGFCADEQSYGEHGGAPFIKVESNKVPQGVGRDGYEEEGKEDRAESMPVNMGEREAFIQEKIDAVKSIIERGRLDMELSIMSTITQLFDEIFGYSSKHQIFHNYACASWKTWEEWSDDDKMYLPMEPWQDKGTRYILSRVPDFVERWNDLKLRTAPGGFYNSYENGYFCPIKLEQVWKRPSGTNIDFLHRMCQAVQETLRETLTGSIEEPWKVSWLRDGIAKRER
ncbi:MAG: hypothetical protein K0R76_676 [Alphaproteobacteria bacterium]|nr:hypothetical protein [Alphaproteobacteria bacterium]